ncbi:MAG: HAD family hydrolase [Treponema sp.]|nr:HAD family hydrolase [Treponema sp.]
MKIHRLPSHIRTIIFDIDSTLYTNDTYARELIQAQLRHYAQLTNQPYPEIKQKVENYQKEWSKQHGGKILTLANTMLQLFGISIETSIDWRRTLFTPEAFLSKDDCLIKTVQTLRKRYQLICVTNNPVLPATKTLKAIGIDHLIPTVIGIDVCHVSKPAPEPFLLAAEKTGAQPEECLSVGDRYDVDLALPLALGMGAIEVTGVKDVYMLPDILSGTR